MLSRGSFVGDAAKETTQQTSMTRTVKRLAAFMKQLFKAETVKRTSRLTLKKVHLKTISFNPYVGTELILHLKYDFLLTPFTLSVGLTSLLTLIGQRINKSYKTLRVDVHLSASSLILAIVWSKVMQFVFMQIL